MQTYTHYVMTALLNRSVKENERKENEAAASEGDTENAATDAQSGVSLRGIPLPPMRSRSLLIGSVMPDLPLIALTIIFLIADLAAGRLVGPDDPNASSSMVGKLFEDWFFNSAWVKAAHNLFHAPILTVAYTVLGYWLWINGKRWGAAIFWLGVACTIHTAIDIPLHYDDGPLIFFPFDWTTRFYSPVSYWDPEHYGIPFAILEHILLLGMLIVLGIGWWRRRQAKKAVAN